MSGPGLVLASRDEGVVAPEVLLAGLHEALQRVTELQQRLAVDASSSLIDSVRALLEQLSFSFVQLDRPQPDPSPDPAFWEDEPASGVGPCAAVLTTSRLSDTCFVGGVEISQAWRQIERANTEEARLVALEAALRKSWRAASAVLAAAQATPKRPGSLAPRERADLEAALAVRSRYAKFRRALRRPVDESPEAVLNALRYAAGALAEVSASPEYSLLRISDRTMLLKARDRLLEWSRAGQPVREGWQLLDDIFTSADLLREINRRQELRQHDERLLLELATVTAHDADECQSLLERLIGLDDELDRATEALRRGGDPSQALDRVRALVGR